MPCISLVEYFFVQCSVTNSAKVMRKSSFFRCPNWWVMVVAGFADNRVFEILDRQKHSPPPPPPLTLLKYPYPNPNLNPKTKTFHKSYSDFPGLFACVVGFEFPCIHMHDAPAYVWYVHCLAWTPARNPGSRVINVSCAVAVENSRQWGKWRREEKRLLQGQRGWSPLLSSLSLRLRLTDCTLRVWWEILTSRSGFQSRARSEDPATRQTLSAGCQDRRPEQAVASSTSTEAWERRSTPDRSTLTRWRREKRRTRRSRHVAKLIRRRTKQGQRKSARSVSERNRRRRSVWPSRIVTASPSFLADSLRAKAKTRSEKTTESNQALSWEENNEVRSLTLTFFFFFFTIFKLNTYAYISDITGTHAFNVSKWLCTVHSRYPEHKISNAHDLRNIFWSCGSFSTYSETFMKYKRW